MCVISWVSSVAVWTMVWNHITDDAVPVHPDPEMFLFKLQSGKPVTPRKV